MTLSMALRLVEEEYKKAVNLEFVHKPLAYALYRVWRMVEGERGNE